MMNQLNVDKIVIDDLVYRKVMHWVQKAPGEVSGLGCVEMRNGAPYVTEVFLLEQENTGTSTDLDAAAVAKLMNDHRDKDFRWWWHSHANMGVFWSGTDNATIKEFGGNGWLTATVFNKQQNCKSAIYTRAMISNEMTGEQKQMDIFLDDVKTEVCRPETPDLTAEWDAEYTAKCKERKVFTYTNYSAGSGLHGYSYEKKKEHPHYEEWFKSNSSHIDTWMKDEAEAALKAGNFLRYRECFWYGPYMEQAKSWVEYFKERMDKAPVILTPPKTPPPPVEQDELYTDNWVRECQDDIDAMKEMGMGYYQVKTAIEEDWGTGWTSLVDEAFKVSDVGYGII